ncbi:transcriptional activator RinB [Staphylococcus gallinarum]|uniref:transcriptional activator RinB n=1 Tax=Staphylococcus gallinarum TaxID=1293 RepID=UPI0030BA0EED
MTKYMLKQPGQVGDSIRIPGEIFEIKKLKHSIRFKNMDEKFKYIVVGEDELLSKKSLKAKFTKGTYKSETPNRLLKTLTIIALYELSKYITEQVIIRLQANDDVDAPRDFSIYDHIHLNEVSKQCSG